MSEPAKSQACLVHLAANWVFRHFTHPSDDEWFAPFLWLGFGFAALASLLVLFTLLRRGEAWWHRLVAFVGAWACFYFLWSWGTVLASQVRYDRMLRLHEELFVLFGATSGMQFEEWDRDTHYFFLLATVPLCFVAAICSIGIHLWNRHRHTPA